MLLFAKYHLRRIFSIRELTTRAPSPKTACTTKSGTGSQEGRPRTAPRWLHISENRTGFGAVPLTTPGIDPISKPNEKRGRSSQFYSLMYQKGILESIPQIAVGLNVMEINCDFLYLRIPNFVIKVCNFLCSILIKSP
jgi:hypothetical protein